MVYIAIYIGDVFVCITFGSLCFSLDTDNSSTHPYSVVTAPILVILTYINRIQLCMTCIYKYVPRDNEITFKNILFKKKISNN